jgi:hypothetical protein
MENRQTRARIDERKPGDRDSSRAKCLEDDVDTGRTVESNRPRERRADNAENGSICNKIEKT